MLRLRHMVKKCFNNKINELLKLTPRIRGNRGLIPILNFHINQTSNC